MTADQFSKIIESLDLTQIETAALLGVDDRTIRRWVGGERDVPGPVVRFLNYLLATGKVGKYAIKKLDELEKKNPPRKEKRK
jgi:DNA-binding transcriptional regulator YiaG